MIPIKEENYLQKIADVLMVPIMYLVQFPCVDRPQRTHFWNNKNYQVTDIAHLDASLFISIAGDSKAVPRWFWLLPLFHIPIFGGWKKFVVLEPKVTQDKWFIGWIPGDVIGVSEIALCSSVKLLRGPQTVFFFGVNEHGAQIELKCIGSGEIGKDKNFSKVQFL
jgi:hypothetical protein